MRTRALPVLGSLLIVLWLAAFATASTGLPFLRLSSGARSAAMAEAATALPGAEAISYNPAALRISGQRSFGFAHGEWIQDIRHEYLAVLFAAPPHTVGIAAQVSRSRNLEFRTGPTAEPLGEFSVYEGTFNLAYARPWTPKLRLGANLKLIRQAIYIQTATGAAVDLGLLYEPRPHLYVGLALRNLGRMNELDQTATSLPRAGRLGVAYAGFDRMLLSLEAQREAGHSATLHAGGEFALHRNLNLRGGYQSADTRSLALGLGLQAGSWSVDYAFIPFESDLGAAHRLSVHLHRDPGPQPRRE